jgi:uncharacterized membrane protein
MKIIRLLALLIILTSFIVSLVLYPTLPDRLVSHWNIEGQPDGYMSRFSGLFSLPIISLILYLFLILIPKIDPLKENIKKFQYYYDLTIFMIIFFLFYVYFLTLSWNLGYKFSMNLMILSAIGILFVFMGLIFRKIKRNWFMGIRTPWTLSNDIVWEKTHKLGSILFVISGIIAIVGSLIDKFVIFFILAPILLSSVILVIYSYVEFKKQSKKK